MPRQRPQGRRPLNRERHTYAPAVEAPIRDALESQAHAVQSPFSTYMERVIALAHGFSSPFLPDPELLPLPIAGTPEDLQEHTARIDAAECMAIQPGVGRAMLKVRIDRALADRINARCDELDVEYSAYLRAVLRPAAGYTTDSVRQMHIQDALKFEDRRPRKRAS